MACRHIAVCWCWRGVAPFESKTRAAVASIARVSNLELKLNETRGKVGRGRRRVLHFLLHATVAASNWAESKYFGSLNFNSSL
jgi:hypothetical protein